MAEQEVRLVVGRQDEVADQVAQLTVGAAPAVPEAPAVEVAAAPVAPPPPAAAPVAAAVRVLDDGRIVDSGGRKLKLRELTLLNELDLMALAGDSRATNRAWWMHVSAAAHVEEIDGSPCPFPVNDPEIRVMVQRVGRDGVAAVIGHLFSAAGDSPVEQSDEAKSKN